MEQEDMLISGNPVAWDIERGAKSRELIAILHKRGYDTEHWAVRLDRASQRVTHVSAGPLLRTIEFKPEVRLLGGARLKGDAELMLIFASSHDPQHAVTLQYLQEALAAWHTYNALVSLVSGSLFWRVCPSEFNRADVHCPALTKQCSPPRAELTLTTGIFISINL